MQNTKEPHRIHNPTSPCSCHVRHFHKVLDGKTYLAEKIVYCQVHDAAPELLKALKALVEIAEPAEMGVNLAHDLVYDKALVAIAKAEGRQE